MSQKIYTKTGDKGETSLYSGQRASKDSARIHAIGDVDELNASLGVARAAGCGARIDGILDELQRQLFIVGADLSAQMDSKVEVPRVAEPDVIALERWIDELDAELKPLQNFILPGGTEAAARLHYARSVSRRTERTLTFLMKEEDIGEHLLKFLNRLSDLLFVMARWVNKERSFEEQKWTS